MSDRLLVSVICGIVGIITLGFYLGNVAYLWRLWRHGVRTSGVVIGNKAHEMSSGTEWEPVIAFHDEQGRRLEIEPVVRIDERMTQGRVVPVVYLAHNPEVMHVFTRRHLVRPLLSYWLVLAVGLSFSGLGLAVATGMVHVISS